MFKMVQKLNDSIKYEMEINVNKKKLPILARHYKK